MGCGIFVGGTVMQNTVRTKILTECALLIALGTILAQVKIYELPQGGSVTAASMVPFMIISFRHGPLWGLGCGFINAIFQMLLGGVYPTPAGTAIAMVLQVLLDYLVPFSLLGLADLFARLSGKGKARSYMVAAFVVCFIRFFCHLVSGFVVWGSITRDGLSAVIYSLSYNGGFMLPETIISVAAVGLLYRSAPQLFENDGF